MTDGVPATGSYDPDGRRTAARGRVLRRQRRQIVRQLRETQRELRRVSGLERRQAEKRSRGVPDSVFIWIPKTAGTSLWELLRARGAGLYMGATHADLVFPNQGLVSFSHMQYTEVVAQGLVSPEFDRDAWKFSVVRNPYDRAVSLFHHAKRRRRLPPQMSFETFVSMLANDGMEPIGLYNIHGLSMCNPQVEWLVGEDGSLLVDHVGRFEDLDGLLEVLRDRLGVEGELPHQNVSTDRSPYREHYRSEETRRNVEKVYGADLERFGYDF